jgi:2-(1,2-epoxy-1,2-dihydrophenyl)acetyl-CoA isomerase
MASPTETETPVLASKADGILTLTLNRPDTLNSLTTGLLDQLREGVEGAVDDDEVRAICITGSGRGFSSGASLSPDAGGSDLEATLNAHYNPLILAIQKLEKPVVAAINGVAAGAGSSIAFACDFRVMSDGAKLACLFVRIGLAPDAGASYFLPRLCGVTRATEIMMLGEDILPDQALEWGLVNRVFPANDFEHLTRAFAERLAAAPRSAGMVKRLMRKTMNLNLPDQLGVEAKVQGEASRTADFGEGVMSFLEKRPAKFTGR